MKCQVCDSDFEGDECPICHAPLDLGEDPERWYDHGRNHWKSGRHGWASRSLERTVELDPKMVKGWIALGIARRDSGEFLTAIQCFDRAIDVDPADDKAYYNKSMTLSKYGINRDALRVLERGIKQGGGLVLLLAKGDLLMDLERYEEALDVYDEALKINPDYKVTLFSRQKCLAKLESSRPRERRQLFRRRAGEDAAPAEETAESGPQNGSDGTEKPPLIRTRPRENGVDEDQGPAGQDPAEGPKEAPVSDKKPASRDMKEAAADATRRRLFRFRGAPEESKASAAPSEKGEPENREPVDERTSGKPDQKADDR